MSILSDFEDRVGRAVEGMFAGVFRSPVQPAELARAAAKEMDRRRKLGVGKVYAPTLYSVLLSAEDGEQLGGFTDTLAGELETYLTGYAHEREYELACRPRVRFLVDEELKLGRFEIIGEMLSAQEMAAEAPPRHAGTPVAPPVAPPQPGPEPATPDPALVTPQEPTRTDDIADSTFAPTGAIPPLDSPPEPSPLSRIATITVPGIAHDVALTGDRMMIGRLKACDVRVQDANVSREHAAVEREGAGWALRDLGSLNGTLLNGERVDFERLRDGDVITVGVTELVYHEPGDEPL